MTEVFMLSKFLMNTDGESAVIGIFARMLLFAIE